MNHSTPGSCDVTYSVPHVRFFQGTLRGEVRRGTRQSGVLETGDLRKERGLPETDQPLYDSYTGRTQVVRGRLTDRGGRDESV